MPWLTVLNAALRSMHVNDVILFDSMDHRMSLVILIMAISQLKFFLYTD